MLFKIETEPFEHFIRLLVAGSVDGLLGGDADLVRVAGLDDNVAALGGGLEVAAGLHSEGLFNHANNLGL